MSKNDHEYTSIPLEDMDLDSSYELPKFSRSVSQLESVISTESPEHINTRRIRRLNTELLNTIARKKEDLERVKSLLQDGAKSNATCRLTYATGSHLAALKGHDRILTVLLENGADCSTRDKDGATPLHYACSQGFEKCVDVIVNHVKSKTGEGTEEDLALNQKVEYVAHEPLSAEISDSFDHECEGIRLELRLSTVEYGPSALHICAKKCHLQCMQILLANGANYNVVDERDLTVLDVLGEEFLKKGFEVNTSSFCGCLNLLVDLNAAQTTMEEINKENNATTPLHIAVGINSIEAISQLLNYGAYPGTSNADGDTPFQIAVASQNEDAFKLLCHASNHEYINIQSTSQFTPLLSAVKKRWKIGIGIALAAGADVSIKNGLGDTAIHLAADTGDLEILEELSGFDIDVKNEENNRGDTPLFRAINSGSTQCVRELMVQGALLTKISAGSTVIHRAVELGMSDILFEILINERAFKDRLIDKRDSNYQTALFIAAKLNHSECVKYLLKYGATISKMCPYTSRFKIAPVHVACLEGNAEALEALITYDESIVEEVSPNGYLPIHWACNSGKGECIKILLNSNADLSDLTLETDKGKYKPVTATDLLFKHISRPVHFLNEVLDSKISINDREINDKNCKITLDYKFLIPKKEVQMGVVSSLIRQQYMHNQENLLLHPIINSFLSLKWSALLPFFYFYTIVYGMFVFSLTTLATGIYKYELKDIELPFGLNTVIWKYLTISSAILFMTQELTFVHITRRKFINPHFIFKIVSFLLAVSVTFVDHTMNATWPRQITTAAVLFSWTGLMFQMSRFPFLGNYVLMFSKVAGNVLKVLLIFGFIIIGFAFSFMIEFHANPPFGSPWEALIKTIVMMTSEFDYNSLFEETDEHTAFSIAAARVVFISFVLLASIVLMNLMVGLAVSDISDLEIHGEIQRLKQQVIFLKEFEMSNIRTMLRFFPKDLRNRINRGLQVDTFLELHPSDPSKGKRVLPKSMQDGIVTHAIKNNEIESGKRDIVEIKEKLRELQELICKKPIGGAQIQGTESKGQRIARIGVEMKLDHLDNDVQDIKSMLTDISRDIQHLRPH